MELHFDGNARAAHDASFLSRVRDQLQLPPDVPLEFAALENAGGGIVLRYDLILPQAVRGAEYGAADGVFVDEAAVALLRFRMDGELESEQIELKDEKHFQAVQAQIRKLAAADAIYSAAPNETIDPSALIAQGKPWMVSPDAAGRKRLKRAFIA